MDYVRHRKVAFAGVFAAAVFCVIGSARAQQTTPPPTGASASPPVQQIRDELERLREEFDALRRQYDERLVALEQRLADLSGPFVVQGGLQNQSVATSGFQDQSALPQPPPAPPAVPVAPDQPPATSSKVFNPDTSIIGNFVGVAGKNAMSGQPSLQMTEVEAAFQAIVDPYARADFFLAAGPEGLEVEEGYVTFTSLPANLLLKVGKMRAQFGKVNTLHTHRMPTADRPLLTANLVGGDEGLSDSGLSLSHLIDNPYLFLEVTGEVYRGESEVFQSSARSRLNYVGRLRAYRDFTEASNIDVGVSFATGPTDLEDPLLPGELLKLNRRLIGVDATFRYRPPQRAIYRRLNLRAEAVWSRQETAPDLRETGFGVYGLGEYQFARRWYAGARFDRSARAFDASVVDTGQSVFVTFWPTEFSQVRGQYRRTKYGEGLVANEFLFQFNFSIGMHGAHVF
jgi:hypothetical protein